MNLFRILVKHRWIRTSLFLSAAFTLLPAGGYSQAPGANQEEVYVDAPAVGGRPANQPAAPTTAYQHQFQTGFYNLEFTEALYYQYSGYDIFKDGSLPNSFFFENIAWNRIVPLQFRYVPGLAYGAELIYFASTSEDAYPGDESVVVGPSIKAQLFITSLNVKAYFMDPFREFLHPFFGIGWGVVFGDFDTTRVGGSETTTSLTGMTAYRTLGTEIKLGERAGLYMEFRSQSAFANTSNDPFDQSPGDSQKLNLDGIMIGLAGTFRF